MVSLLSLVLGARFPPRYFGMYTTGSDVREACRSGALTTTTSGLARGFKQCNMVILPAGPCAEAFGLFCERNPKPCPLLEVISPPQSLKTSTTARDADLRTDLPKYRIYRDGVLMEEVSDVTDIVGNREMVGFLIGCSFSFEEALMMEGIEIRNVTENKNVSMYDTSIECIPALPIQTNMVVSMRPFLPDQIEKVVDITSRFPLCHGAPVHIGNPKTIGIQDLEVPEYGDSVTVYSNEIPCFWACGVTAIRAAISCKPDLCITHSPGCMFLTDLPDIEPNEPK